MTCKSQVLSIIVQFLYKMRQEKSAQGLGECVVAFAFLRRRGTVRFTARLGFLRYSVSFRALRL